jgi:hypothetical protein
MDYVQTYGEGSQNMGKKDHKEGIWPNKGTNGWRIRTNKELQYRSTDTVTSIKVRRLEWAGHVVRIDDERGRRKPGRPRLRWLVCVEDDLKTLGVRRCRKRGGRS